MACKLDQSLNSKSNCLPLAAYLDPDSWNELIRLTRPNLTSYVSRCPATSQAANGLFKLLGSGYCYGEEISRGHWQTFNAGAPGWTHRWCGNLRAGIIEGVFRPLESKDIVRSFCGPRSAIAVSDRFHQSHQRWTSENAILVPPWLEANINSIRFDIDLMNGWNPVHAISACKTAIEVGAETGFQVRNFSTGNRGIQTVFAFPAPVSIRVATSVAELIRKILNRRLEEPAKLDVDSTSSLMRLPGCRHAATQQLALFIDTENRCYFDKVEQANLIGNGLGWIAVAGNKNISSDDFANLTNELDIILDSQKIQHDCIVRGAELSDLLLTELSRGTSNLVDLASHVITTSKSNRATNTTPFPNSETNSANRTKIAQDRLLAPPMPGHTWKWMTDPYGGVWASRMLYGEPQGLDILIDILRNVPASSKAVLNERERTAKQLWQKFKFKPPSSANHNFHPQDVKAVEAMAEIAVRHSREYKHNAETKSTGIDIRQLQNIIKVANVMMYALRESGGTEFTLSERNGSHLSKKFFDKPVSPSTFKRIAKLLETEQRVRFKRELPYNVQGDVASEGISPLVPAFERLHGTVSRYKASKWLLEKLDQCDQSP